MPKPARKRPARRGTGRPVAPPPTRPRRPAAPGAPAVEAQGLPIVRELARIARSADPPDLRLEGALEVLFGAYGMADSEFPDLMLRGWVEARADKQFRLTMAWVREHLRLSLEEIVAAGQAARRLRGGVDAGAVAALMVAAAEGCLLQSPTHGGTVPPAAVVKALLTLLRDEA